MTTYFIAVDNGNRADGYLVANGDTFVARSGGFGRGEIPQGTYRVGDGQRLNPAKKQNRSMARRGDDWRRYRKFPISGVGPTAQNGGIRDARYPNRPRTGVMLHFDGNGPGSEGCIAYDDPAAQQALEAALAREDHDLQVIYVRNDAEARAMAERLSGGTAPQNTVTGYGRAGGSELSERESVPIPRPRPTNQQMADISTIRSGPKMAEGEPTVVVGERQLMAAHVQARHTGGGRIAEGSPTVFVGRQMLAFGRVTDPTTDGSEVATGVPSVRVG
jgi:hypothetical protein